MGDKKSFDQVIVGTCKRCEKIQSETKQNENPVAEHPDNKEKPF